MNELNNFYNAGFGWVCRACERESGTSNEPSNRSRLLREGEAESKNPRLSSSALAKWTDQTRTTLVCPLCGIAESAVKK
ncbi:MAG TPA: hypothetical protein VIL74_03815 [Pyrinomonadaceae bacterium]|jgi:hypothetical protein